MSEALYPVLQRFHRRFGESRVVARSHEKGVRLTFQSGGTAMILDADILKELVSEGLLIARSDSLMLSQAGVQALRRRAQGSGFIGQHKVLAEQGENILVDLQESPLMWLSVRKGRDGKTYLAPCETEAGERLRRDFTLAGLNRRICMSWEPTGARGAGQMRGNHAADISNFAIDARKRLDKALLALEPNLRGLLLDICCFLKGLEEVERERKWPRRSAKLVLKIGLAQLATHYNLMQRQHSGGIRHWRGEGYRPSTSS